MTSAPKKYDIESSLNDLPNELRQNLILMNDLHSKSQQLMTDVDKMADNYMSNINQYSEDEKKKALASIQSKFEAAKELSDDRVQISIQNYAIVDNRIKMLDQTISRFKEQMKLKVAMRRTILKAKRNLDAKKDSKMASAPPSVSTVSDQSNVGSDMDNVEVDIFSLSGALVGTGIANAAYSNMPIDPYEPKYCLCNQVSFGEMVACDNPDCAIEWFHFGCVSLITKPKGKWFCPKCVKDKKIK